MISQSGTSKELIPVDILTDRHFIPWLEAQGISLVFSTYQSSRLMFIGVDAQGNLSGFERVFDRAMGIYATTERIYLSTRYQIWQLDNVLSNGELYQGYDKLYIPRKSHITGDIDTHDLVVEDDSNRIVFVSTKLNILATLSEKHSCIPLWKPSFISSIIGEDRCHLNGLALVDGKARYVTLCAQSDIVDGWRDHRNNGGCVIDIQSNEIITTGLSMPHSPRYYQGKLWLLNAGTGHFGYIDPNNGTFEPLTFCPGFLRGLAFWGDYAIVGISKARGKDSSFKGLPLEQNLAQKDTEPRCGFLVIDLRTGSIKHWIRLEGEVEELYDVQVLPGVKRPQAIGLHSDTEISQYITLESFSPEIKISCSSSLSLNGINVAGFLTGHGRITQAPRGYVESIKAAGKQVALLDLAVQAYNSANPYPINLLCFNAHHFQFFLQKIGIDYFKNKYNIGVWAWELPNFPEQWQEYFNYYNEIWVGSSFMAKFISQKSPIPVITIPHVVETNLQKTYSKNDFGISNNEFVFLFIFDFTSIFERKNPMALVEAFKMAFKLDEPVRLILKSIFAEEDLENFNILKESLSGSKITLIDEYFSKDNVNGLISISDCYVSLHRSEGFGLTLAEAMYLEKPVIATGWSGNMDFMNENNSYLVDYQLTKLKQDYLKQDYVVYKKGEIWAQPDITHAAKLMRYVYENPQQAKIKAKRAGLDIRSTNSLQTISKTIQERLNSIDQQISTIQSKPSGEIEKLYQKAYKLQNELNIGESISLYHQILAQNPQYAPAWYQLGVIADNLGNKNEAIVAYKKALEIDPNYAQAYNNLGIIYIGNKEIEQAIIYFQQAITSKPDYAFAYNNLGLAYQMKERYIEAANRFKQALSINPEYSEAYHNLGNALKFQKQYNQAIVNFETALKLNPNHIKSYLALAECYEQNNQEDKAVETTKFGLLKDPTNLDLNLSLIFQLNNNLGNTQQAKQALENAIINIPNSLELQFERARLFPIIFKDSQEILDYRCQFNQVLDNFIKNLSLDNEQKRKAYEKVIALRSNFFLAYQGLDDLELQIKYGELVTRIMSANYPQWSKKITASKLKKGEKLKIGYISFYVYAHSVTQFSLGWLKYHNRDDFEIYGYHADSDEDFITEEFKKYSDVFHKIPRDLEAMAQQIAKDELHILVYLDLGMTPITMQLAGLRLAPIQCMSWGHPMTSGLPTVDYFLSNQLMEPENGQQYYREKLVRLPGLGMVPTKANLVIETVLNRADFNLPDNKLIYLCSQSLWKYLPQYDYIWPEIAQKVDNSLFVFFRHMSKGITLKFQERIAKAFDKYGLDWQQYCYFSDRLDYHRFLRINELSDVFLDSFVWSGGISSLHAIASSLPVVTCPGEFMRGRQAMALLKQLNIDQTIAKDPAEYIDIAVDLALNEQFRQQIKEHIKNNEHLIYEDRSITQGLTKAYQTMWDTYIKNKPTQTINL